MGCRWRRHVGIQRVPIRGVSLLRQPNEADLLEAFTSFDSNHDGFLSAAELSLAMESLGIPCTRAEADAKVAEADIDGDGLLDFEEFSRAVVASQ